jgi:hypothetical protein
MLSALDLNPLSFGGTSVSNVVIEEYCSNILNFNDLLRRASRIEQESIESKALLY